jgi:Uma2 family endonuclease
MATVLEHRTDLRRSSLGDEPLFEVVDGQRVDLLPMGILSNLIALRLTIAIANFLSSRHLGTVVMEALLILDEESDLRRRPDVAFVSKERWPLDRPIPETGDWNVVPDLAVAVTSPNDMFSDVVAKIHEYFAHGIREAWVLIPDAREVYVYTSPTDIRILSAEQTLETALLPGLSLPLAEVFERTSPAMQPPAAS